MREEPTSREPKIDEPDSRWTRRRVLAGVGATGVTSLAGCTSGGSDGDGTDPTDGDSGGSGDDGGNGNDSGGNGDGGGNGNDTGDGPTEGDIGQVLAGECVSFMVEYVRPVEEVIDFWEFPHTTDEEEYGIPRTVDYYATQGLAASDANFYGVGIAVKNTHDRTVDFSTVMLRTDSSAAIATFPGRSQRLSFQGSGTGRGQPLAPGELVRGELVFALPNAPSDFTLYFQPYEIGSIATDQLTVDLGGGSEATAPFTQDPPVQPFAEPVGIGDFDVTLHTVERVSSITDSPHQELFGPRSGYDYLRVDLSATRTSDVMIGQDWSLGMADDDGYLFGWTTVYQDALELNRTRLEQLSVGESISNTVLAFPVATEFDPTYLTMNATGPFEEPPAVGADHGVQRVCWSLA